MLDFIMTTKLVLCSMMTVGEMHLYILDTLKKNDQLIKPKVINQCPFLK